MEELAKEEPQEIPLELNQPAEQPKVLQEAAKVATEEKQKPFQPQEQLYHNMQLQQKQQPVQYNPQLQQHLIPQRMLIARPTLPLPIPLARPQIFMDCYCKVQQQILNQHPIKCLTCHRYYHPHCIPSLVRFGILLGDDYYYYICRRCLPIGFDIRKYFTLVQPQALGLQTDAAEAQEPQSLFLSGQPSEQKVPLEFQEILRRLHILWADIDHLVLFHLTHTHHLQYFQWKQHLCEFIQSNWWRFFIKEKPPSQHALASEVPEGKEPRYGEPWHSSIASALSSNSPQRFVSSKHQVGGMLLQQSNGVSVFGGSVGWWALSEPMRYPSEFESKRTGRIEGLVYEGRMVPVPPQLLNFILSLGVPKRQPEKRKLSLPPSSNDSKEDLLALPGKEAKKIKKEKTPVLPKKPKKEKKVAPVPTADRPLIQMYQDIKNPDSVVHMSSLKTHTAPQFQISSENVVQNEKGYRQCKCSHGVSEGTWYFECEILPSNLKSHTRIGFSQISADLQAPVGFDQFGYSWRDQPSSVFHCSIGKSYANEQGYAVGDIVGVEIHLPPQQEHDGDLYDPLPEVWDGSSAYVQVQFRLPRPILQGSWIKFYKNGQSLGVAFENLYAGKYYPAVSCYMGAKVHVKFDCGPESANLLCKLHPQAQIVSQSAPNEDLMEAQVQNV